MSQNRVSGGNRNHDPYANSLAPLPTRLPGHSARVINCLNIAQLTTDDSKRNTKGNVDIKRMNKKEIFKRVSATCKAFLNYI